MLYLCRGSGDMSYPVLFLHIQVVTGNISEHCTSLLGSLASHTLCREEGYDKLSLRNAIIEHKCSHLLNTL